MDSTIERSPTHATFVIDRDYPAPIERVWNALSDVDTLTQVLADAPEPLGISAIARELVELERIVFTYDMWVDGRHMSTSLTTIALNPQPGGTHLTYTEQGVHFDGLDDPAGREEGTRGLLDQLGHFLHSTTPEA